LLGPAGLTRFQIADDNTGMAVQRITKEELKQKIEAADEAARPVLVDARLKYPFEHSTLKLPGAVRFAPSADQPPALPKNRELVVYDSDPDEITAVNVAAVLIKTGHRVAVLKGGLAEWAAANFPTESKDAIRPAPPPPAAPKP
jgi:rhodanese-related sulfurtransferase